VLQRVVVVGGVTAVATGHRHRQRGSSTRLHRR
jgi:hypothetical protein